MKYTPKHTGRKRKINSYELNNNGFGLLANKLLKPTDYYKLSASKHVIIKPTYVEGKVPLWGLHMCRKRRY
jgi:hypothetical protein